MKQNVNNLLNNSIIIANNYGFKISLDEVIERYEEPHRYWHVISHINDLLKNINELYNIKKINKREFELLNIVTIFHDIVYNTTKKDNEEKSVEYMLSKYENYNNINSNEKNVKIISDIILNTKTHDSNERLCKIFNDLDTNVLDDEFINMLDWENKIYNEYKWVGWNTYKIKRIEFLNSSIKDHIGNKNNILKLINYLNILQKKD